MSAREDYLFLNFKNTVLSPIPGQGLKESRQQWMQPPPPLPAWVVRGRECKRKNETQAWKVESQPHRHDSLCRNHILLLCTSKGNKVSNPALKENRTEHAMQARWCHLDSEGRNKCQSLEMMRLHGGWAFSIRLKSQYCICSSCSYEG